MELRLEILLFRNDKAKDEFIIGVSPNKDLIDVQRLIVNVFEILWCDEKSML